MKPCSRPLDPLDAAALAAGEPPVVDAEAADHVQVCPSCALAVSEARDFCVDLDRLAEPLEEAAPLGSQAPGLTTEAPDLADRVLSLRPFSRRERRDLRLWKGPILLSLALFVSGLVCLALPGISAREQAGLAAASLAPLAALLISAGRSLAELVRFGPDGLGALSEVLQAQRALGVGFLLLLVPAFFGLTRVLARSRR